MATAKYLIGLRNDIDDLVNESFRSKDGATFSTDDMLQEVKRKLPKQIAAALPALTDIALKRLIDGVGRRKAGRRSPSVERDLFGEYPNIPQTLTVGDKKRKRTSKFSIVEALNYLETHSPRAVSERYEAFRRLVDDCLPYRSSDDDTIEELLARRKQSLDDGSKSAFRWSSTPTTTPEAKVSDGEPALVG